MDALHALQMLDDIETINLIDRRTIKDKSNPLNEYEDDEFYARFRFTKETVLYLLEVVKSDLTVVSHKIIYITPLHQLLVALRYYATGSFQVVVGDSLEVSQSSCSRIIAKVSRAIARKRSDHVKYPTFQQAAHVQQKFKEVDGFPGVVGIVGCTHVKIKSPGGENAELFRNAMNYHSINVQVVCGSEFQICNITARWHGSVPDSCVFKQSNLCNQLEKGEVPGILLGHAGYPLLPYLMTPIEDSQTAAEKLYNESHSVTRQAIDRLCGVWKRKFACLTRGLETTLETSLATIVATTVLYNVARQRNEATEDDESLDDDDETRPQPTYDGEQSVAGDAKRRSIILEHFT